MIAVKRLEIVVDAPHSEQITDLLARHGLTGWTLLRGATGAGERGRQHGDEITGVSSNHLILTTCPPDRLEPLLSDLRVQLARIGGMCLISDASWLRH
jgi:nitrogen regulatory protein P-II 1